MIISVTKEKIMIAKRTLLALTIVGLIAIEASVSIAGVRQEARKSKGGWSALKAGAQIAGADSDHQTTARRFVEELQAFEPRASNEKLRIVGTWVMNIPGTPDAPGFNALQTYSDDGTMTETSDLLAQLIEGPAHGVWSGKKSDYNVTFQLFTFDENRQPVGRIRVRVAIHLIDDDHLTANAAVDFIDLDGTVTANIGSSPFTGTRVKVLPAQ